MFRFVPRVLLVGAVSMDCSITLAICRSCSALFFMTDNVTFWRVRAVSAAIDAGIFIIPPCYTADNSIIVF